MPGHKDLTLQGTNTSGLPTAINVLWNWDDTSVGGGNTLDGCSLFDTDGDGNANAAFGATVVLGDIDATNAVLLNTCSYPSQQPNSDPSDCVLIPGRANPTIGTTPRLVPQDTATLSSNTNGRRACLLADRYVVAVRDERHDLLDHDRGHLPVEGPLLRR